MFKTRIFKEEIIDDLEYGDPLLIENLRDMEFLNRWLGYNRKLIRQLERIRKKYEKTWGQKKIRIIDMGCGSGDGLRIIADWARIKGWSCELIGIDGNENVLDYCRSRSIEYPQIKYFKEDIVREKSYEGYSYDVIVLNNVCHHFKEAQMTNMLKRLGETPCMAIIINDIHRHFLAYWGMKVLGCVCRFSYLTQEDGLLSVKKGFKKKELEKILEGVGKKYEIRWKYPFRWQITIWARDDEQSETS